MSRKLLPSEQLITDTSAVKPDNAIDRPKDNVWIISADNNDLERFVINAVFHG